MSDGKRPGAVSAFRVPMLLLFLAAGPAAGLAQSDPPPGLPPGVYMGEPDYKQATAGTYTLDPDHASVIARVSHIGYSYSIFRFDRLSAHAHLGSRQHRRRLALGQGRDGVDHLQRKRFWRAARGR